MIDDYIPKNVIRRLPRYHRFLGDLVKEGVERISSNDLAELMNVTASQIRQDLNHFGGFGQQGYGYNVRYLYEKIGAILGLDRKHRMVIIGAGNLSRAFTHYYGFKDLGFIIAGIFDNNKDLIGTDINGLPVRSVDDLPEFVKKENVEIAILTVPKESANQAAAEVIEAGISYIWNFAPVELDVDRRKIHVENVYLVESLMQLSFEIASNQ